MSMVSIVVPTYQRAEVLRRTLEALVALDYPTGLYEVLVVDDAGDPMTEAVVAQLGGGAVRVKLLRHDGHGAAAARNAGARAAVGDVLLFLDDDMTVSPNHVQLHVETLSRFGNVLVGGERWYSTSSLADLESTPFGRFRVELERGFRAALPEHRLDSSCVETPTLASCDLSIGRSAFWHIGGFDESFPYAGAEDQDLSLRARSAGYTLVRNLDIRPEHNDPTVTLRQFCQREERGAHTVVALTQKHPETLGAFAENAPVSAGDGARLAAKKLLKASLSGKAQLSALHWLVSVLERTPIPERLLGRAYRSLLGLHIFRGYRDALRFVRTARPGDQAT